MTGRADESGVTADAKCAGANHKRSERQFDPLGVNRGRLQTVASAAAASAAWWVARLHSSRLGCASDATSEAKRWNYSAWTDRCNRSWVTTAEAAVLALGHTE